LVLPPVAFGNIPPASRHAQGGQLQINVGINKSDSCLPPPMSVRKDRLLDYFLWKCHLGSSQFMDAA
jgi:hypothetical protein